MSTIRSENSRSGQRNTAIAGLLLGFGLWILSPALVGHAEPWDAEWPFYTTVVPAGGALIGWAWPRHWLLAFFALWAGQCIALLFPPHDFTWYLLGVATTGIGSLLGLVGVLLGVAIRIAWRFLSRS